MGFGFFSKRAILHHWPLLWKKGIALTVLSKIVWNNFLSNILCMHDIIIATTAVISHTFH